MEVGFQDAGQGEQDLDLLPGQEAAEKVGRICWHVAVVRDGNCPCVCHRDTVRMDVYACSLSVTALMTREGCRAVLLCCLFEAQQLGRGTPTRGNTMPCRLRNQL
eukprot:3078986-Rhodomonas_salina.4